MAKEIQNTELLRCALEEINPKYTYRIMNSDLTIDL